MKQGSRSKLVLSALAVVYLSIVYFIGNGDQLLAKSTSSALGSVEVKTISSSPATDLPPIALICNGCSGSGAIMHAMKTILRAHGIKTLRKKSENSELLKIKNNRYYNSAKERLSSRFDNDDEYDDGDVMLEAMKEYRDFHQTKNASLVFKTLSSFNNLEFATRLQNSLGVQFFQTVRENPLDRVICQVNDCFGSAEKLGYSVYASNGSMVLVNGATKPCFGRRKMKLPPTKIFFHNLNQLKSRMYELEKEVTTDKDEFRQLILPSHAHSYEELFAYEYSHDENVFQRSCNAWMDLLAGVGTEDFALEEKIVCDTLRNFGWNSRKLKPHSALIYNYDQVVETLRNADPPLDHYLHL